MVAGAAGGVGSIAVQLARRAGATVIGLASEPHHAWLTAHGVIPVSYGDGVAGPDPAGRRGKLTRSSTRSAGATSGWPWRIWAWRRPGWTRSPTSRPSRSTASRRDGSAAGASAAVLAELAGLIAAGELEVPIAATFPLGEVQDAYRRLEQGHLLGKIVLLV